MELRVRFTSGTWASRRASGNRQGVSSDAVGRGRVRLGDHHLALPVVVAVLQPLLGALSLIDGAQVEVALPRRLRTTLRHDHPILGASFQPPARFLAELAGRNEIDLATAEEWTRAVCAALTTALPSGVMARIRAQVPALVRAFFPDGERLAPPLPQRAHRCLEVPPMWSEIERPVPSYLMFAAGDPITGRATEGVTVAHRLPVPVLPEQVHVPTHGPPPLDARCSR